jgi:hypothetical protein
MEKLIKKLLREMSEDNQPSPIHRSGRLDKELVDDVINRLLDSDFGNEYEMKLRQLNSEFEPTKHKRPKRVYSPLPPNIKVMRSIYPED